MSYTDMAIWIDNNYYLDDCDDLKLYEYIYHLLFIVAYEHQYFKHMQQYDDYALQGASKLFLRLKDKRQFDNPPSLVKIKSILNYIKTVSYPYKVDFEHSMYGDIDPDTLIIQSNNTNISNYIAEETDIFNQIEFETSIGSISSMIRAYLSKLPRKNNSAELKNIHISCLLTIMNMISASKDELDTLLDTENLDKSYLVDKVFKKFKYEDPILYHLPKTMAGYIQVIVRELQHAIAKELSFETQHKISAETSLKNLIAANLEEHETWD